AAYSSTSTTGVQYHDQEHDNSRDKIPPLLLQSVQKENHLDNADCDHADKGAQHRTVAAADRRSSDENSSYRVVVELYRKRHVALSIPDGQQRSGCCGEHPCPEVCKRNRSSYRNSKHLCGGQPASDQQ